MRFVNPDPSPVKFPLNDPLYMPSPVVLPPLNTSTFSLLSALEAEMVRDEDTAHEAVPNIEPVTPLPLKYNPLPEISNEPVMIAFPLKGNPVPEPAFNANEAVRALDAEAAQLLVPKNEPEYIPSPVVEPPESTSTFSLLSALDAEIARDDDIDTELDTALLAVPSNEPVIPLPLTNSEPVMIALPENGNPEPPLPAFNAYEAVTA